MHDSISSELRPTEFHAFIQEILDNFDNALLDDVGNAKVFQRATIIQEKLEDFWDGVVVRRLNDSRFTKDLWSSIQTTSRKDAITKAELSKACRAAGVGIQKDF